MPGVPEEGHCDKVSVLPSVLFTHKSSSWFVYVRRTRFATFPQVLVIHAKKFQLVNWVPSKLGMFH